MQASPLYVHGDEKKRASCPKSTATGKPDAKITQKRETSAHRTKSDHSRRESLKSNSPHKRLENRMQCFHQGAPNRETSSKVMASSLAKPTLANFSVLVFWPNFLNPQQKSPNPQTLQTQTPNPTLWSPPFGTPGPQLFWVWPPPFISGGVGVVVVMVVVVVVGLDSPGPPCARPPDAGPPLRRTPQSFALF